VWFAAGRHKKACRVLRKVFIKIARSERKLKQWVDGSRNLCVVTEGGNLGAFLAGAPQVCKRP